MHARSVQMNARIESDILQILSIQMTTACDKKHAWKVPAVMLQQAI